MQSLWAEITYNVHVCGNLKLLKLPFEIARKREIVGHIAHAVSHKVITKIRIFRIKNFIFTLQVDTKCALL